jgi:hypothetical protein
MSHIVGSAWVRTRVKRLRVTALTSVLVMLAVLVPAIALTASPAAASSTYAGLSFRLQGCRGDAGLLPNGGGKFICDDSLYTDGNLGPGWNELDLVPHRILIDAGSLSGGTSTYKFDLAADNFNSGNTGYDFIEAGFEAVSGCSASIGSQQTVGTDPRSIYREITVTQSSDTVCQLDLYVRLGLGSHSFPGSSLHSNLLNDDETTAGIGNKENSIPVHNVLQPQELDKDMTATQGSDHVWDITKSATPATLTFTNTCDPQESNSAPVSVQVSWTKGPADPSGPITVVTHVYATNPSHRVITIDGSDDIRSGTTVLDTATFGPIDLPGNTANFLVLTHKTEVPDGTTNLNDVATATYTDNVTGIPVPGTTTATASATVQLSGPELNKDATINDLESITGSGLTFSTDSFSGASGAFDGGYVAGTLTSGSVSWTSDSQSGSGSVTFAKTVYAAVGSITPNGNLHDDATLIGSDGASASTDADVTITVNTIASLTIAKTIPNVLQGAETQTFTFKVKNSSNVVVATPSISFAAGETSKNTTVGNLAPGVYTVSEDAATGWQGQPNVVVDLSGANCTGRASFENHFIPAAARVQKVSSPAGFEAGWTFKLNGPGTPVGGEVVTTTGSGFVDFLTPLGEGSYTITETTQPGWTSDGGSAECSFTVSLPTDAGRTFSCTFTNTYQPSVSLTKDGDTLSKIGDTAHYTLTLTNTGSAGGAAGAPSLVCTITDPTIGPSATRTVTLTPGATDTSHPTVTVPGTAADPFPNTATANCHYPGLAAVVATSSSSHSVNLFQPSVRVTKTGPAYSKVGDTVTYTVTILNTSSSDSPNLVLDSFADTKATSATAPSSCTPLAPGSSCTFTYTYVVVAGDDTGLPGAQLSNTATVHYHPVGFTNNITGSDTWNLTLLHPSFTVNKICTSTQPVPQGASSATFQVRFNNTGDTDLVIVADDGIGSFTLAAGATRSFTVTVAGPFGGVASVSNTVNTTSVTLAAKYGLANVLTNKSSTASCTVGGRAKVIKTVNGAPPSGTQSFTFTLREGANNLNLGTILETQTANAGNGGVLNFATNLVPGQHYQMCEDVMPGWNTTLSGSLFVPGSMITPTLPNPNVNNMTVCTDFVAVAGGTTTFTVDNSPPPGGRALTIGFWKNWASCAASSGNKKPILDQTLAIASTSPNIGLVVSAQNMGSGWSVYAPAYYLILSGNPSNKNVAPSCAKAVNLLDKSTATGARKMASDPLFNMTAQLIGAQLNMFAGAGVNPVTVVNVNKAVLLNGKYQFNGDTYTPKLTAADSTLANCLATQLDNYNNDRPVSSC